MGEKGIRGLPEVVRTLMGVFGAYLAGSAAVRVYSGHEPDLSKDFDLFVAPEKWAQASVFLRAHSVDSVGFTSLGGLRVKTPECSIDLWVSTLSDFVGRLDQGVVVSRDPRCSFVRWGPI